MNVVDVVFFFAGCGCGQEFADPGCDGAVFEDTGENVIFIFEHFYVDGCLRVVWIGFAGGKLVGGDDEWCCDLRVFVDELVGHVVVVGAGLVEFTGFALAKADMAKGCAIF